MSSPEEGIGVMAKADRVSEVVTAAVIEALNKDKSGLVAEITADVINGEDETYGGLFRSMYFGGATKGKTRLERVARDEIGKIADAAVAEWFAERADDIRAKVKEKLDLDAVVDTYTARLLNVVSSGEISIDVDVSHPATDSDDD
jgi:hypothetical protein